MTKQKVKREQTLADMANKIAKLDKENELLGERCNQLLKDKGALLDQIEKMKQELDTAREEANRQEQWELYSVLNGIYNDNFEVITSVSN